jgi:hypothetical protein
MAAADDENIRLAIPEGDFGLPLVEPVRIGEIAGMRYRGIIFRSDVADPVEVERRRHRPGNGGSVRGANQPDGADAGAVCRVEADDRFDDLRAGDHRPAGRECGGIEPEAVGANLGSAMAQFMAENLVAAEGRELPGNPEQIAPMAVRQKALA